MNLKRIMMSEGSQTKTIAYCMIFIYIIWLELQIYTDRSIVTWQQEWDREITKGNKSEGGITKENMGDGYLLSLDCSDIFTDICQNLSNCTV